MSHQLSQKLTRGSTTIFCIENGDYATGQAAIDVANNGDTIVFGPKSSVGSWGNLTIPAEKKLSLVGLMSERGITVRVGKITYSPTTGNGNSNEVFISNLLIDAGSGNYGVVFGGSAQSRLRIVGCYLYTSDHGCLSLTNTTSGSSFYMYDCVVNGVTASVAIIESACPWVQITGTSVNSSGGSKNIQVTSGTFEFSLGKLASNSSTNPVADVSGGTMIIANSSITNSTTNGSGVNISTSGAIYIGVQNYYSIATGTGYCVTGVTGGVHFYAYNFFNDSAAAAGNVNMKNVLTNLPFTTAFTSSA